MINAKVAKKPFIEIPEYIYDSLGIKEGDSIQIQILAAKKQLSKEEKLKLLKQAQGIWADDEKIDEALRYLGRDRGQEWDKEY
ncbi:MAG: hypothetical protein O7E52_18580 [Candidatus Poribacteria bacterium]|nr:hypothetical protein [Candidatus Poribacteria bacterium]